MAALAFDGRLNIDATSVFATRGGGAGIYSISGDVNNAGTNGSLQIDTVLGDDSSKTDRLLIGGDTAGTTRLLVNNVNEAGAQTVGGIRVVGVGGQSNGSFSPEVIRRNAGNSAITFDPVGQPVRSA